MQGLSERLTRRRFVQIAGVLEKSAAIPRSETWRSFSAVISSCLSSNFDGYRSLREQAFADRHCGQFHNLVDAQLSHDPRLVVINRAGGRT